MASISVKTRWTYWGIIPPSDSRYCIVESSGQEDRDGDDSKVATSKIHISAEIGLKGLIEAGVKFILDKVNWKDNKESNTGYQSAAANTGDRSAAIVSGKGSVAMAIGYKSKAKGSLGCWIVLAEQNDNYEIINVQSIKVDGEKIKADTFYTLVNGEFIETE